MDSKPNYSSSESTTSTAVESDVSAATELENTNYNSEGAGGVARVGGAGGEAGGSGGGGSGNRAIMWRWSSRRLEQKMAVREPPARSDCHGGLGGSSPNRLHRRRLGEKGTSNATAPPPPGAAAPAAATTTKTAAVATPQIVRRLGRPRSFPHPSGVINRTTARRASGSDSPAIGLSAADSSPSSSSLSLSPSPSYPSPTMSSYSFLDANPQHVVASMLLNEGGGGACGGFVRGGLECGGGGGGGGGCCGVEMQQQQQEVPASPTASVSSDTTATAPGWAERAGLTGGVTAACTVASPLGRESTIGGAAKGDRDVPRFLRPVILLLTLSLMAIVGTSVMRGRGGRGVMFGPAVQAAGGVQLPEEVVDDIFDRADKDRDGVIAGEEIRHLVEGAADSSQGASQDDASGINARMKSIIKNLDRNDDEALSRSDVKTSWNRQGMLLTAEEVAQWVRHAVQLPQDVADAFLRNAVTGYDFHELTQNQGALLEKDLGITRPAFRRRLTQSMLWKLWKMGEEPSAPGALRASDAYCGALSLRWDTSENNVSFPVHKFVLRRAVLGQRGGEVKDWVTVMDGASTGFLDAGLQSGESYRYNLQAWNAIGHSSSVEIDVTVATKGCMPWSSWLGAGGEEQSLGDLLAALAVLAAATVGFRALSGRERGETAAAPSPAVTGTTDENGDRGGGGGRRRPESLPPVKPPAAPLSSHSEGDSEGHHAGGGEGSPVSASSNGGNWSDKEKSDLRKKPSMLRMATRGHKQRLKRASSEVMPGTTTGTGVGVGGGGGAGTGMGAGAGVGRSSPLGNGSFREPGRPDAKQHAAAIESMRKEAAKRLMPRRNSSREDKEVCRVCRREWRWYRPAKHTCGMCHEQFCDRKNCGVASHSFGACPVGGTCMCSACLVDCRRPASFDR